MGELSKILLVDDQLENLFSMKTILRDIDVEVITASDGNEALQAILEHRFALAILDVRMPGMDGYELAELIRGQEETKTLPLIFLSAVYTTEYLVIRGFETGAVDFLEKPVNPKIIINKVKVFVELDQQKQKLEKFYRQLQEAQDQLVQTKKIEALEEMATEIAHRINQPLHVIMMSAEILFLDIAEKNWKNFERRIRCIQEQVDSVTEITEYLRNFSAYVEKEKGNFNLDIGIKK